MSQWPPSDPSPTPRDPSPTTRDPSPTEVNPSPEQPSAPPRVETYQPPSEEYESYEAPYGPPPSDEAAAVDVEPVIEDPAEYGDDNRLDAAGGDDDDIDETVFELNELAMEQRRHLDMRLTGARVVHRWEVGSDLVVNTEDADAVEGFLDEVENPDGFELEELDELGDEVDDEAVYKAMSDLYVAADRLQHNADDPATAGSFHLASDGVADAPPPFGFDPRVWAQVKELASSVVSSLDADADPEVVERDARTLRQILANYV